MRDPLLVLLGRCVVLFIAFFCFLCFFKGSGGVQSLPSLYLEQHLVLRCLPSWRLLRRSAPPSHTPPAPSVSAGSRWDRRGPWRPLLMVRRVWSLVTFFISHLQLWTAILAGKIVEICRKLIVFDLSKKKNWKSDVKIIFPIFLFHPSLAGAPEWLKGRDQVCVSLDELEISLLAQLHLDLLDVSRHGMAGPGPVKVNLHDVQSSLLVLTILILMSWCDLGPCFSYLI